MFTELNLHDSPYLHFGDLAANVKRQSESRGPIRVGVRQRVLGKATRQKSTFCHLKTHSGPDQTA
jgi:hypothetical protein